MGIIVARGHEKLPMNQIMMLFISHAVSYGQNFIGNDEFKRISFAQLFLQPYKHVFIMHLTIIFGGFLAQAKGSPLYALLVMVGLKTAIDIVSHLLEHRKFQGSP